MKDRLFMMIGHDLRNPVLNLKSSLNNLKIYPTGGPITIRFDQSAREAVVIVTDTGVGMPTTDPLQAASVSNRRGTLGETGTGLGLQVCSELMQRNQGQPMIESRVGRGTTVRLVFPTKADDTAQPYRFTTANQKTNALT